ncbi:MAG: VCBS repeat-containing protein [Sulfitobacter sp.]
MLRGIAAVLVWLAAMPLSAQVITSAEYSEPTQRYPHGVLGDDVEWGNLSVTVRRPKQGDAQDETQLEDVRFDLRLPEIKVFEDIAPRLIDVDGIDGPEVIVVESDQNLGARLAVYGLNAQGVPELRSYTGHIGTRFRWLAPIGVADFDADGVKDIAMVVTPHLGKTAYVMRYQEGMMTPYAELRGLTNHRIGEDFISGGVRDCGKGPAMVLLSPNWSEIIEVRWQKERFDRRVLGRNKGHESIQTAMQCG